MYPRMILNLDMSKSFDKVCLKFIYRTLMSYGFHEKWVARVMPPISKALFSILVNGSPSPTFTPSRGLRQRDPISSYIFLLVSKGLS